MDPEEHLRFLFEDARCEATFCAEPLTGGRGLEIGAEEPVTPASVIKVLGGLMGVVRNEIGVARLAHGRAYVIAAFTRGDPATRADARINDAAIGRASAYAVEILQG